MESSTSTMHIGNYDAHLTTHIGQTQIWSFKAHTQLITIPYYEAQIKRAQTHYQDHNILSFCKNTTSGNAR